MENLNLRIEKPKTNNHHPLDIQREDLEKKLAADSYLKEIVLATMANIEWGTDLFDDIIKEQNFPRNCNCDCIPLDYLFKELIKNNWTIENHGNSAIFTSKENVTLEVSADGGALVIDEDIEGFFDLREMIDFEVTTSSVFIKLKNNKTYTVTFDPYDSSLEYDLMMCR